MASYIRVRLTDEQKAKMQKAAEAKGLSLSAWLRMVALAAADA